MGDLFNSALAAPIANLLIVAGLIFLAIAAIGKIAGKIEPDTIGRVASGLIGGAILALGLIIHFRPELLNLTNRSTPTVQPDTATRTVISASGTNPQPSTMLPTLTSPSSPTPIEAERIAAPTDIPISVPPTSIPTAINLPTAPPPTSITIPATPAPSTQPAVSPDQVIREYWNLVKARNYDVSWTYLSANFQELEHGGDQGNYAAGWDSINPCNIYVEMQGVNQTTSDAQVLVHWILLSGAACTQEEANHEYFLVLSEDRTRWLIDAVKDR